MEPQSTARPVRRTSTKVTAAPSPAAIAASQLAGVMAAFRDALDDERYTAALLHFDALRELALSATPEEHIADRHRAAA